jgi:hypothetical protein
MRSCSCFLQLALALIMMTLNRAREARRGRNRRLQALEQWLLDTILELFALSGGVKLSSDASCGVLRRTLSAEEPGRRRCKYADRAERRLPATARGEISCKIAERVRSGCTEDRMRQSTDAVAR